MCFTIERGASLCCQDWERDHKRGITVGEHPKDASQQYRGGLSTTVLLLLSMHWSEDSQQLQSQTSQKCFGARG